jgi:hypothetical protein
MTLALPARAADYANQVIVVLRSTGEAEASMYCDCQTMRELDAARLTDARGEDRFIAMIAGALPSEVWA